jgi:glucose-6-phosphate 1-dehydrogenase
MIDLRSIDLTIEREQETNVYCSLHQFSSNLPSMATGLYSGGVEVIDPLDHHAATTGGTAVPQALEWLTCSTLAVVVIGASGDLAKKKTYPSLLDLYDDNLLPKNTIIYGYARSKMSNDELRDRLRPFLQSSTDHAPAVIERFLQRCVYQGGDSYGDLAAFEQLNVSMNEFETQQCSACTATVSGIAIEVKHCNRLFYFAIPPNVFGETAIAIKKACMQDEDKGWTRLIVEKPFGRDLESFEELNKTIAQHFTEDHIFRIDHYLGKEMVQNLTVLRFSNIWLERIWNAENIQCVMLTFKEPFGTDGRGGYFDQFGIIRDILQNHLLQVLTLLAMETPTMVDGPGAGKAIRDAKVAVLNAINPIKMSDVVLGQYEGYADDPTISDKETNTPTFATIRLFINTPRWHGVPFILKAGKALNERKSEIRVQFKDAPAAKFLFQGIETPRNELGMMCSLFSVFVCNFRPPVREANSPCTHTFFVSWLFSTQSCDCNHTKPFSKWED